MLNNEVPDGAEAIEDAGAAGGLAEGGVGAGVDVHPPLLAAGGAMVLAAPGVEEPQLPVQQLNAEEEEAELAAMLPRRQPDTLMDLTVRRIVREPGFLTESNLSELTSPCLQKMVPARQIDPPVSQFLNYSRFLVAGRTVSLVVVPKAPSSVPREEARAAYDSMFSKITTNYAGCLKSLLLFKKGFKFETHYQDRDLLLRDLSEAPVEQPGEAQEEPRGPSPESLHELLGHLPLLQTISLASWPASNETLHVIADSCARLRELAVDSPLITGEGLSYLCERCPRLKKLYLGSSPGISAADLRHVLACRPNLRCLVHPEAYNALLEALLEAEENHTEPPQYSLTSLYCKFNAENLPFQRWILKSLPSLKRIWAVNVSHIQQLTPLSQIKENLVSLMVRFNPTAAAQISSQLPEFFSTLSSEKLTKLGLYLEEDRGPIEVDLSQVAEAYPNLCYLKIQLGFRFTPFLEYGIENTRFSELTHIHLWTYELELSELPDGMLVQLLSNPKLIRAMMLTTRIPPEICTGLAAGREPPVFPALETLAFNGEGWTTRQMVELLVSRAPQLKGLMVVGLDADTAAQCKHILQTYAPWITKLYINIAE